MCAVVASFLFYCLPYRVVLGLLDVPEVGEFHDDTGVGRASEVVLLTVVEDVGKTEMIAAVQSKVAETWVAELYASTANDTIFEFLLKQFVLY